MSINIDTILHTPADKVEEVKFNRFHKALINHFNEKVTQKAFEVIFDPKQNAFSGMGEFKDRVMNSMLGKTKISGPDQVYLAAYVQRLSLLGY